jgi:histidyl-tRNA synthetase
VHVGVVLVVVEEQLVEAVVGAFHIVMEGTVTSFVFGGQALASLFREHIGAPRITAVHVVAGGQNVGHAVHGGLATSDKNRAGAEREGASSQGDGSQSANLLLHGSERVAVRGGICERSEKSRGASGRSQPAFLKPPERDLMPDRILWREAMLCSQMARNSFQATRGTRDLFPEDLVLVKHLERIAQSLAQSSGFAEIRPPLFEETRLFTRSLGETSDVVAKEMFSVPRRGDSGGDSYTFRPEGTAGVARAYVNGGFAARAPLQKWYYLGPMFRYERPQKGRERQFTQFGIEAFGSDQPSLDAEVVDLAMRFFEELGFGDELQVRINTMGDPEDRERWREKLREFFAPQFPSIGRGNTEAAQGAAAAGAEAVTGAGDAKAAADAGPGSNQASGSRCADCRDRFERNILRLLDCKLPQCQDLNKGAPGLREVMADESSQHFADFLDAMRALGRQPVEDPSIVRGLDYYTRTVFEIHYPPLGARSALCGGGRYDGLVEEVGGPHTPAVGFAVGFTATELALAELNLPPAGALDDLKQELVPDVYVVAVAVEDRNTVLAIAADLRRQGARSVITDHRGKSMKAQLKEAGKVGARYTVIVGEAERTAGTAVVRDMAQRSESTVAQASLAAAIGLSAEAS